ASTFRTPGPVSGSHWSSVRYVTELPRRATSSARFRYQRSAPPTVCGYRQSKTRQMRMKCPQKVYRPLRRSSSEARRIPDLVRAVAETLPAARGDRIVAVRRVAIVPALNEAATIARVVEEIRAVDPGFEILVVDDGSTDDTQAEAERAGALVARLPYNVGIGGAVQTGYQYARDRGFQVAVHVDGDW